MEIAFTIPEPLFYIMCGAPWGLLIGVGFNMLLNWLME